jgi:hypothetical protein
MGADAFLDGAANSLGRTCRGPSFDRRFVVECALDGYYRRIVDPNDISQDRTERLAVIVLHAFGPANPAALHVAGELRGVSLQTLLARHGWPPDRPGARQRVEELLAREAEALLEQLPEPPLDPLDVAVIRRFVIDGESEAVIAMALSISVTAVKTRRRASYHRLRALLG